MCVCVCVERSSLSLSIYIYIYIYNRLSVTWSLMKCCDIHTSQQLGSCYVLGETQGLFVTFTSCSIVSYEPEVEPGDDDDHE